ncbi:MAG: hypothetical protein U0231_06930 [Nitrospiraceae bacterium]
MEKGRPEVPGDYVYVKYITLRNGKRIYASQYGLKAFRLRDRRKGR